jgi:hypothetical protein
VYCKGCKSEIDLRSGERLGFRDTCTTCSADLHTCTHCSFHDPSAYNECREPNAERVGDRTRANRCDCFSPEGLEGGEVKARRSAALGNLDALFKK